MGTCINVCMYVCMNLFVHESLGPIISGSLAQRDLQLKASFSSSPTCTYIPRCIVCMYICMCMYVRMYESMYMYVCTYVRYYVRCKGCLKLQVSFCKRATNYRALLRKMTYKVQASYAFLPTCMHVCTYECMYVCMYVCVYVCMHACMYVCTYV